MSNDASLNFGSAESFSIQAWFKTSSLQTNNIILKYKLGPPAYYQLWIINGKVRFKVRCSNNLINRLSTITSVTDNKWHYVVGVRDTNTDEVKLYLDGQLENSSTDSSIVSLLDVFGLCSLIYSNTKSLSEY